MKKEWQQLRIEVVQMEDVVAKLKALAYSGDPGGCLLFDHTDPPCYNPSRV